MKVFLVEDEENKAENISSFLNEQFPSFLIESFRSFQSGLKAIVTGDPGLVLLDMTMTNYDVGQREPGGRERRYAGREILRQIRRRKIQVPVIVITQYERFEEEGREVDIETLRKEMKGSYPDNFIDALYYNASTTHWMEELSNHIHEITGGER